MARIIGIATPRRLTKKGYPEAALDNDELADEILSVLKTIPGERVYRPTYGCYVSRLLFANMSRIVALRARAEARRAIQTWVKRVIVDDIVIEMEGSTIKLHVIWRPISNSAQRQQRQSTIEQVA